MPSYSVKVVRWTLAGCLLAGLLIMPAVGAFGQSAPAAGQAATASTTVGLAAALAQQGVTISYHAQTGKVRFMGAAPGQPMAQPVALAAGGPRSEAARGFLSAYGALFGLTDQAQDLVIMREAAPDAQRSFVRFQQVYQGIPVLGGELIVQVDPANNIPSASGEILPDISLSTTPALEAATAVQTALAAIAKWHSAEPSDLLVTTPELWIYNPVLTEPGSGVTRLVWRLEVTSASGLPIRELILIDAQRGSVALHFNQIDTALNRTVYDNQNTRSSNLALYPPVCTEGNCPGSGNDYNFAYAFAGDTYDFFLGYHGRNSLNGAGMPVISTVRYCPPLSTGDPCPYPNAFWNGVQMVYGQGYANADDVVGHEMTHAVTDYESRLFYFYQSGAINESFSDVWGEFIDQTNSYDGSGGNVQWMHGEDLADGAGRNMQDPPNPPYPCVIPDCSGAQNARQPDKMSSAYYYTGTSDNGGVHINSGLGNKAAYLMTQGGTFNGQTVTGLGITKVAKIYYEVQTNLVTSGADYADLYDALYQACLNLVGTAGITSDDCQQVRAATLAVEMNQSPAAGYNPEAQICDAESAVNLFYDNLENGFANWSLAAISGHNQWMTTDPFGPNPHSGGADLYADDGWTSSSSYAAMVSAVTLPVNAYLHFYHCFDLQTNHDGGVIEYSANGGAWTDAGSLINSGQGYVGAISGLQGRQGFTGTSHGYVSTRLNLASLAGQNAKLRWRMGTDASTSVWGWWVDDLRLYTCGAAQPDVTITKHVLGANLAPGDPVTFTLSLANIGSALANDILVTDTLPAEVVAPAIASTIVITPVIGTAYVWHVAPLTGSQAAVITITAQINAALPDNFSFGNTATISDPQDGNPTNNTSSVTVRGGTQLIYLPLFLSPPVPVTVTVYSMADSRILQGYSSSNYGSATDMWAGYDDYLSPDGQIVRSLVRFDTASIPTGAPVTQATLKLYFVRSWDFPNRSRAITPYRITGNWSEYGVTWNAAPGFGEAGGSASMGTSNWGWKSFDVTAIVQRWISGAQPNYGFMVRGPEASGSDSSWRGFSTREGDYTPQLVVTYLGSGLGDGLAIQPAGAGAGHTTIDRLGPATPGGASAECQPGQDMKCLSQP